MTTSLVAISDRSFWSFDRGWGGRNLSPTLEAAKHAFTFRVPKINVDGIKERSLLNMGLLRATLTNPQDCPSSCHFGLFRGTRSIGTILESEAVCASPFLPISGSRLPRLPSPRHLYSMRYLKEALQFS